MNLPYALGAPPVRGRVRVWAEDFIVDEMLGFVPDGRGGHLWLAVRKREENTAWVAKHLARIAGCAERDVGYSGLKDRHAVTTQWFSLPAPRKTVDWSALAQQAQAEIVVITRHGRKLRRGTHRGNRFLLTVRDVEGDWQALTQRLERVATQGVPNGFAEQRFGREGGNLEAVHAWFAGGKAPSRAQQGMLLSTARSQLFNDVLAERIHAGNWQVAMPGEPLILDGRQSFFIAPEGEDPELAARIETGDVHTSGPLWGRGGTQAQGVCAAFESAVMAHDALLAEGVVREGLEPARRALRVIPRAMHWQLLPAQAMVRIGFELPAGSYATAVLRELVLSDTP